MNIILYFYYSETNARSMKLYEKINEFVNDKNWNFIKFNKLGRSALITVPKIILSIDKILTTIEDDNYDKIVTILRMSTNIEHDLRNWESFKGKINTTEVESTSDVDEISNQIKTTKIIPTNEIIKKSKVDEAIFYDLTTTKLTLNEHNRLVNNLINLQELIFTLPINPIFLNLPNLKLLECELMLNHSFYDFRSIKSLEILILKHTKKSITNILSTFDLSCLTKLRICEISSNYEFTFIKFSETILESLSMSDMCSTNAIVTNLKIISTKAEVDFSSYSICENFKLIKEDNVPFKTHETNQPSRKISLPVNVLNSLLIVPKLSFVNIAQSLKELTIETKFLEFSAFDVSFPSLTMLNLSADDTIAMTIILPTKVIELFIRTESKILKILLNTRIEKITGDIFNNIFIRPKNVPELYHIELKIKEDYDQVYSKFTDCAILKINEN